MSAPTVAEVMALVARLEAAETPEERNIARSLIALKVIALSGESAQAAFEALRPLPEKVQAMGNIGGRAVKPVPSAPMKDAPLDQVVEGLVAKLELVPVDPKLAALGAFARTCSCRPGEEDRQCPVHTAEIRAESLAASVPWGEAS